MLSGCQIEQAIKEIPFFSTIYSLPDMDQRFVNMPVINWFISHRSILTHNALVPLITAYVLRYQRLPGLFFSGIVGCLFALHFLLDLFPKKWYGYAFIHVPLLGWMDYFPGGLWFPTAFSIIWLSLNMLLSLFAFVLVLRAK